MHSRTHTNWKLDKSGKTLYLVDPSNGIRDSVAYPELASGVSWGIVDGGVWKYFGTPTPEKRNTEATAYDGMGPSVDFGSIKAGFYERFYSYFDTQTIIRSFKAFLEERALAIAAREREVR